jgi:hypothetical protein
VPLIHSTPIIRPSHNILGQPFLFALPVQFLPLFRPLKMNRDRHSPARFTLPLPAPLSIFPEGRNDVPALCLLGLSEIPNANSFVSY